jgi:TolB protein
MTLLRNLCLVSVLAGATTAPALAQDTTQKVRIGLEYDRSGKPGVAITQVTGPNADSVRAILVRDLDFSDRVTTIPLDSGPAPTGALNYDLYAKLNAIAVIQASVTPAGALHVAVHEVSQKRVVSVIDIALPAAALSPEWRQVIHVAADSVEFTVLGQKGIASTRILFSRNNQIWSVDSDGAGLRAITGDEGAMSPAWGPRGDLIAYSTTRVGNTPPRIVVRELDSGKLWTTRAASMNGTPAFSPDGTQLMFASGNEGTDLFAVTPFSGEAPQRVSSRRGGSNMSPTYSPDARRVAFTSGLIGHPEVYIMDADGSNVDLLTDTGFGDRLYRSNPSWSPNGRRIAYQSRVNDAFQIMTISVTDRSVSQLTSEGENEDPSWAPDGRHLVFTSTRGGNKQLWVLDTESSRTRQLTRGAAVQNPAWSPRLELSRQP